MHYTKMAEYFVKVDDGKELRRQLLEGSKLSIGIIKQEFAIKEMRARKEQLLEKVRDDLKELLFLIGTLEKELPVLTKKELNEMAPKKIVPVRPVVKKEVAVPAQPERLSKLQRLESSLEMIEKRLNKL